MFLMFILGFFLLFLDLFDSGFSCFIGKRLIGGSLYSFCFLVDVSVLLGLLMYDMMFFVLMLMFVLMMLLFYKLLMGGSIVGDMFMLFVLWNFLLGVGFLGFWILI